MASLRSIMNPDEDVMDPRNKKDQAAAAPGLRPPQHSHDSTSSSYTNTSPASQQQQQQQQHQQHQHQHALPDHSTSATQGRRRSPPSSSSQRTKSAAPERRSPPPSSSSSSALLPSGPPSSGPGPGQRSSVTPDSMDHPYSHGRPGLSSKSTPPMRPFPGGMGGDGQQAPLKYTPVTGRVSKALKGMPVHTCNLCVPPKTFTRNEHLKRHQLSHQKPAFVCGVLGCDREFHRKDLLERHQQRHEQEGDKYRGSGGQSPSRRSSNSASDAGTGGMSQRSGPSSLSGGPSLGQSGPVDSPESSSTTPGSRQAFQPVNSPGSTESVTMSPARRPSTTDNYGRPRSQGQNFGNYGFSSSPQRQIPLIHQPMTPDTNNTMNPNVFDPRSVPHPLILQTQFPPSEHNPPDLMPSHDAVPSSASSTYSAASEWSRTNRLFPQGPTRSGSGDWVGANGYLSPSPFPATPREMQSPMAMDAIVPATSSVSSAPPYIYTHPFTSAPLLAPTSSAVFPFSPMDPALTSGSFTEEPGVLEAHQHPNLTSIVRSPTTPPPIGAAHSETLVTQAAALPSNRIMNSLSCMARRKEGAATTLLAAPAVIAGAIPLSRAIRNAIPSYLDVYWERFHPLYPVVHRRTFEEATEHQGVLRYAMAAVATQYLPDKDARFNGSKLHDHALQEAGCYPQWTLPVMQAIFLCEFYARFRGRKTAIRPSNQFDSLYQRVLEHATIFPSLPVGDDETRWRHWLDLEARRRLLAACFVVDVHTAVYHEQPCVRSMDLVAGDRMHIPLTDPTAALWDLQDAGSWAAAFDSSAYPFGRFLSELDATAFSRQMMECFSPFDRSVILASEALLLPRRPDPSNMNRARMNHPVRDVAVERILDLFPNNPQANTYLALHHTPLLDLLAVSGDSWVFGLKVRQQSSFKEQQERLRPWANSRTAGAATVFAARALVAFLDGDGDRMTDASERAWKDDMSDYWGMYVCALICWAFGYHASRRSGFAGGTDEQAIEWLRGVAEATPGELGEVRERRREAGRVVALVRARLEEDCVSTKNRLYADAITILKKLEEGRNWPWF